jgi:hypothetical protein
VTPLPDRDPGTTPAKIVSTPGTAYGDDMNNPHTALATGNPDAEPLTSHTITDEQIRELHAVANESQDWDTVMEALLACPDIGGTTKPTGPSKWTPVVPALQGVYPSDIIRRMNARARCAEILNKRTAVNTEIRAHTTLLEDIPPGLPVTPTFPERVRALEVALSKFARLWYAGHPLGDRALEDASNALDAARAAVLAAYDAVATPVEVAPCP